jgi:hypothetical protein
MRHLSQSALHKHNKNTDHTKLMTKTLLAYTNSHRLTANNHIGQMAR